VVLLGKKMDGNSPIETRLLVFIKNGCNVCILSGNKKQKIKEYVSGDNDRYVILKHLDKEVIP
jgi:hypothetical protein